MRLTILMVSVMTGLTAGAHADGLTTKNVTSKTPPVAPQPPAFKVAVVPGIAVNLEPARVDAIGQNLAEALASELLVEAIGGLEVRRSLPPEGVPPDCVSTPACVQDVGARLGAQQLLFVAMVDTGASGAVQIDSTWVEVASGRMANRPAIDIATLADARSRFAASATALLPEAPVRPKPLGGGDVNIDGKMAPAVPRHFTTPAKITAGAALVGLGVGIGFGIAARSKYNDCDSEPMSCAADFSDQKDSIRRNALIADIGYVVAIGGAIATAALFATSSREAYLIVAPNEDGGAAVTAGGRF